MQPEDHLAVGQLVAGEQSAAGAAPAAQPLQQALDFSLDSEAVQRVDKEGGRHCKDHPPPLLPAPGAQTSSRLLVVVFGR